MIILLWKIFVTPKVLANFIMSIIAIFAIGMMICAPFKVNLASKLWCLSKRKKPFRRLLGAAFSGFRAVYGGLAGELTANGVDPWLSELIAGLLTGLLVGLII